MCSLDHLEAPEMLGQLMTIPIVVNSFPSSDPAPATGPRSYLA